jgi:hypothetical protein
MCMWLILLMVNQTQFHEKCPTKMRVLKLKPNICQLNVKKQRLKSFKFILNQLSLLTAHVRCFKLYALSDHGNLGIQLPYKKDKHTSNPLQQCKTISFTTIGLHEVNRLCKNENLITITKPCKTWTFVVFVINCSKLKVSSVLIVIQNTFTIIVILLII